VEIKCPPLSVCLFVCLFVCLHVSLKLRAIALCQETARKYMSTDISTQQRLPEPIYASEQHISFVS